MSRMTPQQKTIAEQFLKNPNREQALNELCKQYGISEQQLDLFKGINMNNVDINKKPTNE